MPLAGTLPRLQANGGLLPAMPTSKMMPTIAAVDLESSSHPVDMQHHDPHITHTEFTHIASMANLHYIHDPR